MQNQYFYRDQNRNRKQSRMSYLRKVLLAAITIKNLHVFILDYIGLLRREVQYVTRNGGYRILARGGTADCKEIAVVMSGYEYRLDVLPRMTRPVIWDLGGHIGTFTLYAIGFYGLNNAQMFVFEPDRDNYTYLRKNLLNNSIGSSTCKVFQCAIGDYNGQGILDKTKNCDAYVLSVKPTARYQDCAVRTLTSIAEEERVARIDILKIDIEGGEYSLFKHKESLEFLANRVSFILLEHHYIDSANNLYIFRKLIDKLFVVLFENSDVIYLKSRTSSNDMLGSQIGIGGRTDQLVSHH